MMAIYDPADWYWIVGGDGSRYYSSKARGYIDTLPDGAGVTRIGSEDDLWSVLLEQYPAGLPVTPERIMARYTAAISAHLDAVARQRSYDGSLSISTYLASAVPQWAAEAAAYHAWRDQVWVYVYAQLAAVLVGEREQPSVADLIAELPEIDWPEAEPAA